ncbi:MAG: hypothetical protein ACRDHK_13480 [Actinomycetota bacterium]
MSMRELASRARRLELVLRVAVAADDAEPTFAVGESPDQWIDPRPEEAELVGWPVYVLRAVVAEYLIGAEGL